MKFKNPFKRNKQLKQLQALSASFAILDEFERRGILHYHRPKSGVSTHSDSLYGSLLIEETLATLKLAEGTEGFRKFLNQVAQWQNYRLLQEAYEAHRIDIEAKAVREAKKKYAVLTKADIQRIRQNARSNMEPLSMESGVSARHSVTLAQARTPSLSLVQEFDLFIIRASAPSSAQATEANGQLLALGHYDGKALEMAMYDDIKHNLQKAE